MTELEPRGLGNRAIASIRTNVPLAIGAVLTWLGTRYGLHLDAEIETGIASLATAIVAALYYWGVRKIAERWPQAEKMLGSGKVPLYSEAEPRAMIDPDTGQLVEVYVVTDLRK
ncbi:hypothetical protein [Glycomyces tarimensis]